MPMVAAFCMPALAAATPGPGKNHPRSMAKDKLSGTNWAAKKAPKRDDTTRSAEGWGSLPEEPDEGPGRVASHTDRHRGGALARGATPGPGEPVSLLIRHASALLV